MKVITIPNLAKYQHYKDRKPIWIKWEVNCLKDNDFGRLNNEERWLFIGLIILAVMNYNIIPKSPSFITKSTLFYTPFTLKTLTIRVSRMLAKMEKLNLIEVKMLSGSYQDAIKKEKEKEKDIRKETELLKYPLNKER